MSHGTDSGSFKGSGRPDGQARLLVHAPGHEEDDRTRARALQRDAVVQSVFTPVRAATTFEETVERLGTAIRTGILPAGSQLPAERVLADELGISRSTLRQALTTLVQSGLLISLRGRGGGTFVTERPPLTEADEKPLGGEARAVLDL